MIEALGHEPRAHGRGRAIRTGLRDAGQWFLPVAVATDALLLWAASVPQVHTRAMGATGLVSVLPVWTFLSLALLNVSFIVCLARGVLTTRVLALHVAMLLVMLHATTAIAEPEPAFQAAYRHVGIADYIGTTGGLDTTIDSYFNWPGFFAVVAFVTHAAGLKDALELVPWAPLFYNLLYLGPLLLIFRALDQRRRVVWLALWLFYIVNWTAQDYFSPQATAYFLYLSVIAVLLRWFTPPVEPLTPIRRVGLLAIVIGACVAIVPMHQLTPFALLASVLALVLFAGCTVRLLPVLIAVLIAGWQAYMAVGFLSGHLTDLVGSVGNLTGTVAANVGDRVGGAAGHRLVVEARLLLTGSVWVLAAAGWWLMRRAGSPATAVAALAIAPLPLLGLQTYGGEILIRIFLFALPFTALLAACGLEVVLGLPRAGAIPAAAAVSLSLLAGFLFARYGNERMDSFSSGDVAGVQALYRMAPAGSVLIAASQPVPWQAQDYHAYRYQALRNVLPPVHGTPRRRHRPVSALVRHVMRAALPRQSFLIVTHSQITGDELLGTTIPPAATIAMRLRSSRLFRVAYASPDASIFVLNRLGQTGRWQW
jgi:hypothetical protein